jgi:hypothetical protein
MKKTFFTLMLVMLFAGFVNAQSVLDFTLENATGEDLYGMYVSPVSDDNWGEDIIPEDILPNGHEVEVKFTIQADTDCNWDIKLAKDEAGNSVTISDVNLCGITKIILKKQGGKYIYKTE